MSNYITYHDTSCGCRADAFAAGGAAGVAAGDARLISIAAILLAAHPIAARPLAAAALLLAIALAATLRVPRSHQFGEYIQQR